MIISCYCKDSAPVFAGADFFTGAMSHKMLQGALGEIKGQDVMVEYCPTSSVSALKKVLEKYA